jgi:hypothetical protein
VKTTVPPGAAAGAYWMQGRAYSASTPPEESSKLSGRVAFEVRPVAKPTRPWWPYAVAAALVLVVVGVVGWLVLRPGPAPTPPVPAAQVNVELEAESLAMAPNPLAGPQPDCCAVVWSNHAQLWFRASDAGQDVQFTFTLPADADYTFAVVATKSYDYGNTTYAIDGRQIGNVFFGYSATVVKTNWLTVGSTHLSKGAHTLTLNVVGKSNASKGFYAGIDRIRFATGGASPSA